MDSTTDSLLRAKAFDWLNQQTAIHGDILSRKLLMQGFEFQGNRYPLINMMRGIWKPMGLEVPLSILTGVSNPYKDYHYDDGTMIYKYMGTDPNHPDNRGFQVAAERNVPLIYFKAIKPGYYLATYPVYIVDNDPANLQCMVDLSPSMINDVTDTRFELIGSDTITKKYALRAYERRVHQAQFRDQVLHAYRCQCAMCRLKHVSLLDAAHIIPDKEERGDPIVPNGLALCKIHHAAFDHNIIGITPDYIVEVREDVLEEVDGPMLKYGLQSMHGQKIQLPGSKNARPDPERLELRYRLFLNAG
jgi:putative restriction endonuclease